jgi:hypothetical protein
MPPARDIRKLWNVEEIAALQVRGLELFAAAGWDPTLPWNAGFEEARKLLEHARTRCPGLVALHDVSDWSEDQLRDLYEDRIKHTASALHPAGMRWNYKFRTVLGTNSRRGCYTGAEVPVLIVTFTDPPVPLVAPHASWRNGRQRTMLEVLRLLAADQWLGNSLVLASQPRHDL